MWVLGLYATGDNADVHHCPLGEKTVAALSTSNSSLASLIISAHGSLTRGSLGQQMAAWGELVVGNSFCCCEEWAHWEWNTSVSAHGFMVCPVVSCDMPHSLVCLNRNFDGSQTWLPYAPPEVAPWLLMPRSSISAHEGEYKLISDPEATGPTRPCTWTFVEQRQVAFAGRALGDSRAPIVVLWHDGYWRGSHILKTLWTLPCRQVSVLCWKAGAFATLMGHHKKSNYPTPPTPAAHVIDYIYIQKFVIIYVSLEQWHVAPSVSKLKEG